jgi:hypothetical protein
MTSIEVPDGYVLVPARMELTPENMEALAFMLGGDPDAKDADERWNGGTLWVGETVGDNGEKYYGLNVANVECYEEGSIPIVEFAAAPAASGGEDDPYAFSESRREHEAACRDRMNVSGVFKAHPPSGASVSERARNMLSAAYREADMHEHAYNLTHYPRTTTSEQEVALSAIERALSSPRQEGEAVAWSVIQIGNRGAAYDSSDTKRAFTYDHQPGNIDASRLGRATDVAAVASAGDSIDRGLALLKALQENGFGVFQVGPPVSTAASTQGLMKLAAEWRRKVREHFGYGPSGQALLSCAGELESLLASPTTGADGGGR